jgi:RND family efflux transporter MFP subunit
MRATNIVKVIVLILLTGYSCKMDERTELQKLKNQEEQLSEKIKTIEKNKTLTKDDPMDTLKFKLVGVTSLQPKAFDHYIKVEGRLDGDHNTAVFADVPGTISARYADVGQNVSKGQVLAQIDDQQYRSQLESLESQYRFALDMFEKQKRLWDQKIGSEVQYLQSKTNKETLEQQISSLKTQIEKFKIKSPLAGTIEECNIKAGSVVSPDPRMPAYRVLAFSGLKVSAEVSEAYAARVNVGDKLLVIFPDINRQIESKVDFVSRYINPLNRTFIVESRITDKFPDMKANMIAILEINDYHSESAIQVPMNIIQTDPNGSYVYILRKKENYMGAFKQPVVIGNTYNGIAEILKGLEVKDKVISTGFQELVDGEYVRSAEKFTTVFGSSF